MTEEISINMHIRTNIKAVIITHVVEVNIPTSSLLRLVENDIMIVYNLY